MDIVNVCHDCGYSMMPYRDAKGELYYVCTNCKKMVKGLQSKDHKPHGNTTNIKF